MKKATRSHLLKAGAAALLLAPALAFAHNYNYLEGGYVHRDQAGDEDGFRANGSFDVLSPVAVFGEYDDVGHFEQLSVGGLWHTPLTRNVDLDLGGSYEHYDYNHGGSDSGFGLRGGVRWMVPNTRLELDPGLRYVDLGHGHSDTSARLDGLYQLTAALDLQAAVQSGDDDRFEAGVRYNFGPRLTGR
ncbi:hypothetical protein [Solimonas terrae]|uniref:Porin family protein n=1 Tax=Solimonas terrae TaxID=1396819 RepID=A0A6M2BYX1_9GAMM|nr:hypothetical protein [Solimonas terrae]NGY06957.1 hypothetical protein [Solimonas terrae]